MERREESLADKMKPYNRVRDFALGIAAGGAITLIGVALRPAQASIGDLYIPISPLCFRIAQPDLPKHSPAYWLERDGLRGMSHETRTSLRCRGEIAGKLYQWESQEIWVERMGKAPALHE